MSRKRHVRIDPLVSDALRDQANIARWYEKPRGRQYLTTFSQYEGGLSGIFRDLRLNVDDAFADVEYDTLSQAETFAVSPDMHELIHSLSIGEPGNTHPDVIADHELPAPIGFVRLPKPIIVPDRANVPYPIRAIAWRRTPHVLIGTSEDPARCALFSCYSETFDDDPYRIQSGGKTPPGPSLSLLHFSPLNLDDIHAAWRVGKYGLWAQYLALFWLIANQKLASVERGHRVGPLAELKAREAKIIPTVTVVRLRRERVSHEKPTESKSVEWSHRWMVKAHWKTQHFGPGNSLTKSILVEAFVKGPDDKPLIIKQRPYLLDR